ncbi:hypothetical protein SH1V18_00050 [Vallitalea longa]|uniref:Uncharacterized protein n=1 Tax=Vallitalea longa TaxID=2936439 RepID=A0A9W6DD49_9FIRM|nr:hypothetical protein [Vallitalea longa]GKX27525.1 hypothetical protein SH1V18_00050 [Vallitalea longa]
MGIEAVKGITKRKFAKAGYEKKLNMTQKMNNATGEKFNKSVLNEIQILFPDVHIHVGTTFNNNKALKCFALGCVTRGNNKNIVIEQNTINKLEDDNEFKHRVISSLIKQFDQFISDMGDIKVLAQGTIIYEDGTVNGWILSNANMLYVNSLMQ